ncbi:MAG: ATP-binding protein [Methanothrix sp.]|jgi:signal transduction histidine kinase|nr:ATP-binding protein [Methanothrix sp.]MCK9565041.1 ATP-binding protein [Methanothrix sp.]
MKGIESVMGYQEEIIEAIPSTIIVVNRSMEVLYVNKNYYVKSIPKRERDVLGVRLSRVIPSMLIEKTGIIDKIREVFLTGVPFDGDQIRYPGGMFYFYKIYPLKEDEEYISKVVIFMENITELTRLEEELRESYVKLENAFAELKENDEIKSEFISTASHELRTPITVINSYVEMFEGGMLGELSGIQREKVAIIRSQIEHMIRLVEDMLDVSRLESKALKINKYLIRVDDIARKALDDLSRLAGLKEQSVSLTVVGALTEVEGDDRRIKQVFNNLLTNAIKYTPKKGKIDVIITDEPEEVCVSIIDNGIGVAKKDQHRIFEKFYTGSGSSLTRESGRMGLGLAIAKGIIEAHEGRIWVTSEIGMGSTFIFTLPKKL